MSERLEFGSIEPLDVEGGVWFKVTFRYVAHRLSLKMRDGSRRDEEQQALLDVFVSANEVVPENEEPPGVDDEIRRIALRRAEAVMANARLAMERELR